MSARDDLIYRITRHCSAETAASMVDAFRAEVLREAAALVEDRACVADYMESLDYAAALHSVVELLNHKAGAL